MKLKKMLLVGLASLSLGTVSVISKPMATQAISIYNEGNPIWRHPRWVTLTKSIKIIKLKNTIPIYKSYQVGILTAKRGYHYKLGHWGSNYSWTLESGKFNSHTMSGNGKYAYMVDKKWNSHNWFRFGIH